MFFNSGHHYLYLPVPEDVDFFLGVKFSIQRKLLRNTKEKFILLAKMDLCDFARAREVGKVRLKSKNGRD